MFKRISLRLRLTIMTIFILTICCIGLTFILNISAVKMVDIIDNSIQTLPSIQIPMNIVPIEDNPAFPTSADSKNATNYFRSESIIYSIIIILLGGCFTYYFSGRALKPLNNLNKQIKEITVHNLSKEIKMPQTKDEVFSITASFNEMTNKLNTAFETQKRFSSNAAHELKTPIAVLQVKVDVFNKKSTHTDNEYASFVYVIKKHISRLSEIVDNLLNMTNKPENLVKEFFNLKSILENIILELSTIAEEKNVKLILNCNDTNIYGNIDLLYHVFYNIVENGIKYNLDNGTVIINVSSIADKITIEILDTGIGISDDIRKSIFEPFYRADESRSKKINGVGLGLSIVDTIIKQHDGTITVTNNKDGVGSCFTIIL